MPGIPSLQSLTRTKLSAIRACGAALITVYIRDGFMALHEQGLFKRRASLMRAECWRALIRLCCGEAADTRACAGVGISVNFDKLESIRSSLTIAAKLGAGFQCQSSHLPSPTLSEAALFKGNPNPEQEQLRYPSGIMKF